ncbi:site-specific integrase [Pedobacter sp. L105]|uniref:site-specific integrase n=1 Tax=Pedobacter sp. L105 TaxID=1641871 RepID=UPI00131E0ABD|nr:site-specific integrase [Pedobacter sp. L105]
MPKFTYANVRICTNAEYKKGSDKKKIELEPPTKWWIAYKITFDTPVSYQPDKKHPTKKYQEPILTHYPKIYGKEYGVRFSPDSQTRAENDELADDLLRWVKNDLEAGLDPKTKGERELATAEEEQEKATGVTYDEAYQGMIKFQGWINPNPAQVLTAKSATGYFNRGFREFVSGIDKLHDVTKISREDLEKYITEKNDPNNDNGFWSIRTCQSKIDQFGYFFAPLIDNGKIEFSPITGMKKRLMKRLRKIHLQPIITKNRFEIWSDKELEDFHTVALKTKKGQFFRAIGMCCYHACIRRSEILRLKLSMYDRANKRFSIPSDLTKAHNKYDNNTLLHLQINDELFEIMESYVEMRFGADKNPDYPLFPSYQLITRHYNYTGFDAAYVRVVGKYLDNRKSPYALKHTAVTRFWHEQIAKGVHPGIVITKLMKKCRHSSPDQTIRYLTLDLGLDAEF